MGNRNTVRIAALLGCLGLFALLTGLSILKYEAFNYSIDVGNFLQAFHRSLDGDWMVTTLDGGENNYSRWAGHTEFISALLFPFFALFPHAWTLLALQAAAIASGGLAVFLLARDRLQSESQALLCALAYLSFPFLSHLQFSGFHTDPFLIAPFLLAWHFHRRGNKVWFWAMVALATSVKEYACVFNFLLGLVIFREQRKSALALFALAMGQFLVITPFTNWLFRERPFELNLEAHILPVKSGMAGFFRHLLANTASSDYILKTLAVAALFGYSWIRYPKGLLLVLPLYGALTVLSTDAVFVHHHFAMLLPALFITLVEGTAGMRSGLRGRYLAWGVLAPSLLFLVGHPRSQVSINLREVFLNPGYRNIFHYRITPHDRMLDTLLASIPGEMSLAIDHNLRPKATDREWAFIHPQPRDSLRADRYLFDFFETTGIIPHETRRRRCAALLRSPDFFLDRFEDGVVLLSKGPPTGTGSAAPPGKFLWEAIPDTLAETWPQVSAPEPGGGGAASENDIPVQVRPVLRRTPGGYVLEADYLGSFGNAEALVSVFTRSPGDSLRVLHLPGYLIARLSRLTPGHYRESFPFRGPEDLLGGGWRWEIRFHRDNPYLPLAGRPDQVLERRQVPIENRYTPESGE